jgi:hypothetical protein
MENPFLSLKHYRRDAIDPKENHATEILAACLSLSDNLKQEFVLFLFDGNPPFDRAQAEAFEVATQQQLGGYGIVDLLLEVSGIRSIVVEVKVDAKEDGAQIKKYRNWLEKTKSGEKYVFSLVKREGEFDITTFGGDARRSWWDLYNWFRDRKKEFVEASELKMLENFCNYLEVVGIVSQWQPKQIVDYGRGIVAQRALRTLFEQVEEKLLDLDQDYLTKIVMKDNEWPRLEIGRKSWTPIFGTKGYLNKLYVYYETAAAWEGGAERFYFEVYLWNKWHRGDWRAIEPNLRSWIPYLKSKEFDHWTILKGSRELEGKGADEYEFAEPPYSISACASESGNSYVSESEILKMTSDQLVDELFRRALGHSEIISGLSHA